MPAITKDGCHSSKGENEWQSGSVTTESASGEKGQRARYLDRRVPLARSYVKQAIPEARTWAEAVQAQTKIKRDIFDDKYNRAAGNKDFAEFVDEVLCRGRKRRSEVGRMTRSAQDR
jgi:hypothetical protein